MGEDQNIGSNIVQTDEVTEPYANQENGKNHQFLQK